MSINLTFKPDGTFKIVQFTDIHIGDVKAEDREKDDKTVALMERVIAQEKPDLVVLTGDLHWSKGIASPQDSCRKALAPVLRAQVPWTAVFGNHDAEAGVTREQLLSIWQESEYCLADAGPADVNGLGNYVLTVKRADGTDGAALYFLDSGNEAPKEIGGYAWIHPNQVYWYTQQAQRLAERQGGPLPALAFFHIPFPEYNEAWIAGESRTGAQGEKVCCPKINTGLFGAMVETGGVMGTFVGHDHDNDYCGTVHGIRLCYGRVTGYNTYGHLPRGARVIELRDGARSFETWIAQDDGSIIR